MLENTVGRTMENGLNVFIPEDVRCICVLVAALSYNAYVSVLILKLPSVVGRFHRGVPACKG